MSEILKNLFAYYNITYLSDKDYNIFYLFAGGWPLVVGYTDRTTTIEKLEELRSDHVFTFCVTVKNLHKFAAFLYYVETEDHTMQKAVMNDLMNDRKKVEDD